MATDLLGRWGESLAAAYLREKKYRLLAASFRCRFGEIDLIAENREYLVFVEVKLRKNADFGEAREFVDRRKQDRIRKTAEYYLCCHPETEKQPRFDVIEVYAPNGIKTIKPKINHLEDAFS